MNTVNKHLILSRLSIAEAEFKAAKSCFNCEIVTLEQTKLRIEQRINSLREAIFEDENDCSTT